MVERVKSSLGLALAGCLLISAPAPASAGPPPRPVEFGLRRTILVQGREEERFSLAAGLAHYRVPGVSIAIVDNCRIVDVRGFGRSTAGKEAVSKTTSFQAGSISKVLAAVAALKLVEQGKLAFDADIRPLLTSWNLPNDASLAGEAVTLRRLLSHTAGTNVPGMRGYEPGAPLPTTAHILAGLPPANTAAVRVEVKPGSEWKYSGGGYVVAQALMTDVTGQTFPELMDRLVLRPTGMVGSSYMQPARPSLAAHGTAPAGSYLPGGWRLYPEMAAAGLWTTPSDLGRFAINLARSRRGEPGLLRPQTATQMITRGLGNWGLGVDVGPTGAPRQFSHTGRSMGFTSMLLMYPDTCQGAAAMTNGDEGRLADPGTDALDRGCLCMACAAAVPSSGGSCANRYYPNEIRRLVSFA